VSSFVQYSRASLFRSSFSLSSRFFSLTKLGSWFNNVLNASALASSHLILGGGGRVFI
jgi:hypothetical protein